MRRGAPRGELAHGRNISYIHRMNKDAISVTLSKDNLIWLRARSILEKHRSLSDTLDHLILEARERAGQPRRPIRSVKGTARIAADDPDLAGADAALRKLFDASLERTSYEPGRASRRTHPMVAERRRR